METSWKSKNKQNNYDLVFQLVDKRLKSIMLYDFAIFLQFLNILETQIFFLIMTSIVYYWRWRVDNKCQWDLEYNKPHYETIKQLCLAVLSPASLLISPKLWLFINMQN